MQRRKFIVGTAAVGAATATAGCATVREVVTGKNPQKAAERMEKAVEALEAAEDELEAESDRFDGASIEEETVDVETDGIETELENARSELDEAEEFATSDQQDQITALRGVADIIGSLGGVLDAFADGHSATKRGFDRGDAEEWESAATQFGTASDHLATAESELEDAQATFDDLDREALEELDIDDLDTVETALEELATRLSSLRQLVDAMEAFSLGLVDFESASTESDAENWSAAESGFLDAKAHFETANDNIEGARSEAPGEYTSTIDGVVCLTDAMADAMQDFADASAAAAAGNDQQAVSLFGRGAAKLERCDV